MDKDSKKQGASSKPGSRATAQKAAEGEAGATARIVVGITLELSLVLACFSACALPNSGDLASFALGAGMSLAASVTCLYAYCDSYMRPLERPKMAIRAFLASAQRYVAETAFCLAGCLLFGYLVGSRPADPVSIVGFIGAFSAMWFAWPIPKQAAKACAEEMRKMIG